MPVDCALVMQMLSDCAQAGLPVCRNVKALPNARLLAFRVSNKYAPLSSAETLKVREHFRDGALARWSGIVVLNNWVTHRITRHSPAASCAGNLLALDYLPWRSHRAMPQAGPWCNGNTGVFGALIPGSNPGGPASMYYAVLPNGVFSREALRRCAGTVHAA